MGTSSKNWSLNVFFPGQVLLHCMQFLSDCQRYINTGLGYGEQVCSLWLKIWIYIKI